MFLATLRRIIRALRIRAALHRDAYLPELDDEHRQHAHYRSRVEFACTANRLDEHTRTLLLGVFDARWPYCPDEADREHLLELLRERAASLARATQQHTVPSFLRGAGHV